MVTLERGRAASWLVLACVVMACGGRSSLAEGETKASAGQGSTAGSPSKAGGSSGGGEPSTAGSPSAAGGAASNGSGDAAAGAPIEPEVPCPPGVLGHCSETNYPVREGYTLALVEDFPGPLDLDRDELFTWSDGTHEGSQASFRKQNITFAEGRMSITAETDCEPSNGNRHCYPARESYAAALSPNRLATLPEMDVWSGELRSKYNNYRFGWYEFKGTAPSGDYDPDQQGGSYWEMKVMRDPRNVHWNQLGFSLGGHRPNIVQGLVVNKPRTSDWGLLDAHWQTYEGPPELSIQEEHVYAFAWAPDKLEWFVDGERILEHQSNTQPVPTLSGKIKMNLWLLDFQTSEFPLHASFDYVRFYRHDSDLFYPCAPAPTCLPLEDKSPSAQNNPNEVDYGR